MTTNPLLLAPLLCLQAVGRIALGIVWLYLLPVAFILHRIRKGDRP